MLTAIAVTTQPAFRVPGSPTPLFRSAEIQRAGPASYDVSALGRWFVIAVPIGGDTPPVIGVVQNWHKEFRDREQD